MRSIISDLIGGSFAGDRGSSITIADQAVRFLCECGMGPAAFQLLENDTNRASDSAMETLLAADLTARVLHEQTTEAVTELLEALDSKDRDIVLLKGISIAEQHYQPPWKRVMGDVDILVPPRFAASANEILYGLGYREDINEQLVGIHHHLPAMRHPDSGVIVEIHTALFPPGSIPASLAIFNSDEWNRNTVQSEFRGVPVKRFSSEYQVVYTSAHWAIERKWPVSIFPYFDVAHLAADPEFDWARVETWMTQSKWLAACTAVMLSVLVEGNMATVPESMTARVESTKRDFGKAAFNLLRWLTWTTPLQPGTTTLLSLDQRSARETWRRLLSVNTQWKVAAAASGLIRPRIRPLISGIRQKLGRSTNRQ